MELPGAWLLLAPAGLLGLLAIVVPVAIHLISRGRGRRVLIGNIELVRAARQTRATTLKLTEWLLLLLRVLIILVATLLLARLALQGLGTVDAGVSYVTPGWLRVATETERNLVLSLDPPARVLVTGFPEAGTYEPAAEDPDYDAWPLLAERLSTLRHTGAVTVYAEGSIAAFGDERPALPGEIIWNLNGAVEAPAAFESSGVVVYDPDKTDEVRQVERALEALRRHRVPRLEWTSCVVDDSMCLDASPDWVVWLSSARPSGLEDARLHRPPGPESTLTLSDPRYPEVLLDAILDDNQRRAAWGQIPASNNVLSTGAVTATSVPLPYRSLYPWLGLLLVLLWAVERLLSEQRRPEDG